ncbi:hypothetical protein GC722_00340 [Auraticoccus sp. F435]|uniref:PD-(D/E)XK nuclease family protein n=1 Tax=Auraticoccus cholistanensis TaxID=2656650 RepID=A0A6A9UZY6_9ACTN|nr:PD-(D/E)XK nuclease family protein [Auraticoccus cholistanensis]MVA74490.1 hypothetical protein [Auraticoccus cholistanensis]
MRHLLSLNNENDWSNVLASLMESDPVITRAVLGLTEGGPLVVRREVTSGPNRPDLVVGTADGTVLAVIEVKILSGLGKQQLERYEETITKEGWDGARTVLLTLGRLPLHLPADSPWLQLFWEKVLAAYAESADVWVSTFARAALNHLSTALPAVSADLRWCSLGAGEDFALALRARQAWVFGAVGEPAVGEKRLHPASGGRSWVTTLRIPTGREGYEVIVEVQEDLPVRLWPRAATDGERVAPKGPSVRICLLQGGVTTSAGFDWDWLLRLWQEHMSKVDKPWVTNPPNLKSAHDRAGRQGILDKGAPPFLGIGYGDRQTQLTGECLFGARYLLGDVTLRDVAEDLNETTAMAVQMAASGRAHRS